MNDRLKKIKDYKTELIFMNGEKEETKELSFRTPSMSAQDDYIEIREKHQQELTKITTNEQYAEFQGLGMINSADFVNNPDMLKGSIKLQGEITQCNAKYMILYYQASVDSRQLSTVQKEQFGTDPDSEFWKNQNLVMMEDAVSFFRGHLKV